MNDQGMEFVVWGIPPNGDSEKVLYTKATSMEQANRVAVVLKQKYDVTNTRVQVIDFTKDPDFGDTFAKTVEGLSESSVNKLRKIVKRIVKDRQIQIK